MNNTSNKKTWSEPTLTVFGNVEALTLQPKSKSVGLSDGFTFNGLAISG